MKRTLPITAECSEGGQHPQEEEGKRSRTSSCEGMVVDSNGIEQGLDFTSVHEAFDSLVKQHGDRPAVVEDEHNTTWTYSELQAASLRIAAAMTGYKVATAGGPAAWPSPVALLLRRSFAWVAATVAAMRIGVPSLSLSGDLRNAEESQRNAEALVEHLPFLLVLDAALKSIAPPLPSQGATIAVVDVAELMADKKWPEAPILPASIRNPDDVLYIVYTGGTTSASKSVAVTHRMALHELKVYPEMAPLQCTDRILHQSSAYWGATSLGIFDVAWSCGGCLVITEAGAGPAEVATVVRRHGITTVGIVPSVLEALEPNDCPSIRVIFTWGEALSPSTAKRWSLNAALFDLLIASEYWLILVSDYRDVYPADVPRNGSVKSGFRPVPGARLTLLRPDREGSATPSLEMVQDGEVGELYMAGPMVSAIGYTNAAKNQDAFVSLPVGNGGSFVRHFRTRDLARRRPDGSLEYCGRADGFAKVGGKWLDLAAVERRLLENGCREAALVWDEQAKQRHAAVVLQKSILTQRSLSEFAAELQRLLPRDTRLHMRARFPHNAATGKLNRGHLIEELTTETASSSRRGPRPSTLAAKKIGKAFVIGLLLAGRGGARGAFSASLAWRLAPGMRPRRRGCAPPVFLGLPEGLLENIIGWASWHSSVCSRLPAAALRALPHVYLLLSDAQDTSLEPLVRFFEGPVGILGLAMVVTCCAKPWMLRLLTAAGSAHAHRARGGAGWLWAFWIGLPFLCDYWESECWTSAGRGKSAHVASAQFLRGARVVFSKRISRPLPTLHPCNQCGKYVTDGAIWRDDFYCIKCNDEWQRYMDGDENALPDDTPMPQKAWQGGSNNWRKKEQQPEWVPGLSEIEFADAEVAQARALMPDRTLQKPAVRSSEAVVATPVGRIVERCSGVDGSDPSSSLDGIESLKLMAIVSAIRRELGLALAAGDVARCTCLCDLETLCDEVKTKSEVVPKKVDKGDDDGHGDWGGLVIPRFFRAPVGWLIRLDAVPQERAMHAAACALVKRHPGLRAQPYSKKGDEALAEMCNRVAPMLAVMQLFLGDYANEFIRKASEGVLAAWPRIKVTPSSKAAAPVEKSQEERGPEVAHFHLLRFSTMAELRKAAWLRGRSRGFKTPAQVCVLVLSGSGTNGHGIHDTAYLHVAVNHAVCDAFCIVPLLADLLTLHGAAVQAESNGWAAADIGTLADKALEIAALPRCPNGLAVQQARLQHALHPKMRAPDAQDITHNVFAPRRHGHDHYVRMKASACKLLEAGSAIIGVPPDHLLVVMTAAAYACITELPEVKLSLIVPTRDGTGEGNCIANLATTRHLTLWLGKRSFLAVALDLSQRLRRREWELSDAIGDDGDRVFINVRDIPKFDGARAVMEDVDTKRSNTRFVRNVMEMFVDKESETSWAFIIGIRDDLDGNRFGQALKSTLWTMAVEPMGIAIPSVPPLQPQASEEGWMAEVN